MAKLLPGGAPRFYGQLPHEERAKLLKERLKKYCQRVRCALRLPPAQYTPETCCAMAFQSCSFHAADMRCMHLQDSHAPHMSESSY